MSLRKVTLHDGPVKAEQDVIDYYRSLMPQQRLDEMLEFLNKWGKWNERRFERVVRVIDLSEPREDVEPS